MRGRAGCACNLPLTTATTPRPPSRKPMRAAALLPHSLPKPQRATQTRAFGPRYANGPLEAAWGLALMARAAELLKHGNASAWTPAVERRFFGFVDALLMPNLRYYDSVGAMHLFILICTKGGVLGLCGTTAPACSPPPAAGSRHPLPRVPIA